MRISCQVSVSRSTDTRATRTAQGFPSAAKPRFTPRVQGVAPLIATTSPGSSCCLRVHSRPLERGGRRQGSAHQVESRVVTRRNGDGPVAVHLDGEATKASHGGAVTGLGSEHPGSDPA